MKRTLALVGLAFLILAPPAHAQQDGEWQARNEAVSFTGTGENGTCEPQTIDPFTFDLRFGPGTEVRTLQDGQITGVGNFDPQTGAVTVARGGVSKELTPDGQGGWTGSYNSNGCSWTLNGETNEAGLVFVPAATQEAPAGAVGAGDQQAEGGGIPIWILGAAVSLIGGTAFFFMRRHPSPQPSADEGHEKNLATVAQQPAESSTYLELKRCNVCTSVSPAHDFLKGRFEAGCPRCGGENSQPASDEEATEFMAKELGRVFGDGKTDAQLNKEFWDEWQKNHDRFREWLRAEGHKPPPTEGDSRDRADAYDKWEDWKFQQWMDSGKPAPSTTPTKGSAEVPPSGDPEPVESILDEIDHKPVIS